MKVPFKTPRFASIASGLASAFFFAALFSFIGNMEYWLPPLQVEFNKPSPVTLRLSSSLFLRADQVRGAYTERWFLVRVGEEVKTQDRFNFIGSYVKSKKQIILRRSISFFIAAFLVAFFFSQNMRYAWPGRRRYLKSELGCYFLMLVGLVGAKAFLFFTHLPFTLMPLASITAITVFFLGRHIGFMMGIVVSFIAGMMLDVDLIAFLFFLVQGLSVLPILKYYRRKKRFIAASISMAISGAVVLPAMIFVLSNQGTSTTIHAWRYQIITAAAGGGIICYPMLWLFYGLVRPLMDIVSQSKLNELQEIQHPLLKKLQQQAPATWEHSRAIANLAEEAAAKIGADALLVRVGAYFHDIGKAAAPEFFVENYGLNGKGGEGPHENLPPEKSAELIIDHVIEGVKILRSNGIPESIVEFVYTHHGTVVVEYFWLKYGESSKDRPEEERLPRSHFTYPGMRPQSPEEAILMLADSVEAASRTLTDYSTDELQKMVSHVVMMKLLEGQLNDSGLKMENLNTILKSFVDSVHFSHHLRIKYQWQKEEEKARQPEERLQAGDSAAGRRQVRPEPAGREATLDQSSSPIAVPVNASENGKRQ